MSGCPLCARFMAMGYLPGSPAQILSICRSILAAMLPLPKQAARLPASAMSHCVPLGSLSRRGGSLLYFGNRLVKLLWTRTGEKKKSYSVLHKARRQCWCFIGRCNPWAARVRGKDREKIRGDALPSGPCFEERNSWSSCHVGCL